MRKSRDSLIGVILAGRSYYLHSSVKKGPMNLAEVEELAKGQAEKLKAQGDEMANLKEDLRAMRELLGAAKKPSCITSVEPMEYDGGDDLDDYLDHFEAIAEVQKWTVADKAYMLKARTTGKARSYIKKCETKTYAVYVKALRKKLYEKKEQYVSDMKQMQQSEGETVGELAYRVGELAELAYGRQDEDAKTRSCRDAFIDALKDSHIRQMVRDLGPEDFDEAVSVAKRLVFNQKVEAKERRVDEKDAPKSKGKDKAATVQSGAAEPDYVRQLADLTEKIKRLEAHSEKKKPHKDEPKPRHDRKRDSPGRKPRGPPVCFHCQHMGHIQRYCPFKDGQRGPMPNSRADVNPYQAQGNYQGQGMGAPPPLPHQ